MALLALLMLAFGLAACGDSDDGGSGAGGAGGSAAGSNDERQVRTIVEGLYDDLADYDAKGVCQRMSPRARRQIAAGSIGGKPSRDASCAQAFGKFLDLAKRNGGLKLTKQAKVGKVKIDGDEARVTVSFGRQSGQIPLSKIDGEWKMGVSLATPSAPTR